MDETVAGLMGAVIGAVAGIGGGVIGAWLTAKTEGRAWLRDKQADRLEAFNSALLEATGYAGWFDGRITPPMTVTREQIECLGEAISALIRAASVLIYSPAKVQVAARETSRAFETLVSAGIGLERADEQVALTAHFLQLADDATLLIRKELGVK